MTDDLSEVLQCGSYFPATVKSIFHIADANQDGVVSGQEAVAFFLSTGLQKEHLSQVWEAATNSQPGGLTLPQFSRALRLVSLLQAKVAFNEEFVGKALHPQTGLHLPTPKIGQEYLVSADTVPRSAGSSPTRAPAAAVQPAAAAPAAAPSLEKAATPKPSFLKTRPQEPARPIQQSYPTTPVNSTPATSQTLPVVSPMAQDSGCNSPAAGSRGANSGRLLRTSLSSLGDPSHDDEAALLADTRRHHMPEETCRMHIRLQPINSAEVAPSDMLQKMAAGRDLLVVAPVDTIGAACYARASSGCIIKRGKQTEYSEPRPVPMTMPGEDPESVPCVDFRPERLQFGRINDMLMCPYSGMFLTGHSDGRVVAWTLPDGSEAEGVSAKPTQRMIINAHSRSAVSALLTTPWGALWTGGKGGSLRWFPTAMREAREATGVAFDISEVPNCELRRHTGERAHARVVCMQLTASGQVVAVAGGANITLWDAYSGTFLGILGSFSNEMGIPGEINPAEGLQVDPKSARAVSCPSGQLPPLGTEFVDMIPPEDTTIGSKVNTAANVASSVASTFAKKGFSGVKNFMSKQKAMAKKVLAAPDGTTVRLCVIGVRDFEETGEGEGEAKSQSIGVPANSRKALVVCPSDNTIWALSRTGKIEVFTSGGKLLKKFTASQTSITVAKVFGTLLWLGLSNGRVVAVDTLTHQRCAAMPVHDTAVQDLQQVGFTMYVLAANGAITGINACIVPRALKRTEDVDERYTFWKAAWLKALEAWGEKSHKSVHLVPMGVRVCTWNVGETRPGRDSLQHILGVHPGTERELSLAGTDIVVVGLQEVEMGTASVFSGAVKERINRRGAEQGNSNARWWENELHTCLMEHDQPGNQAQAVPEPESWCRIGMRQLSGMLLMVFARQSLKPNISHVATGTVGCGVGGFGGNKGAVAVSVNICRHRFLMLTSHFAAHQNQVSKRNADYSTILKRLALPFQPALVRSKETPTDQPGSPASPRDGTGGSLEEELELPTIEEEAGEGYDESSAVLQARPDAASLAFRTAAAVVWCGDFNYRITLERYIVTSTIDAGESLDSLLVKDQARSQIAGGAIFHGLTEARIGFNPTYKFDKGTDIYDSGEKKRIPAWTDRIFFKGSVPFPKPESNVSFINFPVASKLPKDSLDLPDGVRRQSPEQLVMTCSAYTSLPQVQDSDHKPVVARLRAEVPNFDYKQRRRQVQRVLSEFHNEFNAYMAPHIHLPTYRVNVKADSAKVTMRNDGHGDAVFLFRGRMKGDPEPPSVTGMSERPTAGFPPWLSVYPVRGVVPAGGAIDIQLNVNKVQATFLSTEVGQAHVRANLILVVDAVGSDCKEGDGSNLLPFEVFFQNVYR